MLLKNKNEMAFDGSIPSEVAEDLELIIRQIELGEEIDKPFLKVYFAPTAHLQECAMANDWHDDYMRLATKFDGFIDRI